MQILSESTVERIPRNALSFNIIVEQKEEDEKVGIGLHKKLVEEYWRIKEKNKRIKDKDKRKYKLKKAREILQNGRLINIQFEAEDNF
jgi:hypothetical protein